MIFVISDRVRSIEFDITGYQIELDRSDIDLISHEIRLFRLDLILHGIRSVQIDLILYDLRSISDLISDQDD